MRSNFANKEKDFLKLEFQKISQTRHSLLIGCPVLHSKTYEIPKKVEFPEEFILNPPKSEGKKLEFQKKSYEIPNNEGINWNSKFFEN